MLVLSMSKINGYLPCPPPNTKTLESFQSIICPIFHVFVCGYCDSLIMLLYFDFLYKFCIAVVAFEVAVTSLSVYCPWGEK